MKPENLCEVSMIGIQHVKVSNRDASFKFDLYRNITIVRGKSGTGKTTLYDMIADYTRLKDSSGVNISCTKDCVALVDLDWKNQLSGISDSIVFIDEGAEYIKTPGFAHAAKNSDNYYVIFSRESLHDLPYSVDEIYEIKTSGKFHKFEKMFKAEKNHIYARNNTRGKFQFDIFLTEDSKSGYQFYKNFFASTNIVCESSGSNSEIFKWLRDHKDKRIFVVADGAAFGSEIDRVLKLQSSTGENIKICLPESFEWLILKSGLIKAPDIISVLQTPSEHIESKDYFSWEMFFEDYLVSHTVNTHFQYTKKAINPIYLKENNSKKIIAEIRSNFE